jgi:peptide/nickel transport system permease protein
MAAGMSWLWCASGGASVQVVQALGCRHLRIIASHILPNVTAPILIIASIWLGNAILYRSLVEFRRTGHPTSHAVVGFDAEQHRTRIMEQAPWLAIFPGLAMSLAVMGFNFFGDTLRDMWDPKLCRRG